MVDGEPLWCEPLIDELLSRPRPVPLFVQGTVANQGRFYDRFGAVVLLSAPAGTIFERLAQRTNNPFGKTPRERHRIAADIADIEPLLRQGASHEIDTSCAPDEVASRLIAIAAEVAAHPAAGHSTVTAPYIEGERVVLRKARDGDIEGVIELQVDARVRRFLGGPRPEREVRAALESVGAAALLADAGCYVLACKETDEMIGTMVLDRREPDMPGHVDDGGHELELTYVLRRHAWGRGYAGEAARALLRGAAAELCDQPVLIVTQTANRASLRLAKRLGFSIVETFEQWGAEQTLATARLHAFRAGNLR